MHYLLKPVIKYYSILKYQFRHHFTISQCIVKFDSTFVKFDNTFVKLAKKYSKKCKVFETKAGSYNTIDSNSKEYIILLDEVYGTL